MLTQVLSYHQVMPEYVDFLHAFGQQENARGKVFTGFHQQTMLGENIQLPWMIGRSWRQYQMCYNLRGITSKLRLDGNVDWSVRQAAFHHQFDVTHGNAVWVVTKGRKDLLERFDNLTKGSHKLSFENPQDCFRTSLEIHRVFCRWAAEDWIHYTDYLEDDLSSKVSTAVNRDPCFRSDNPDQIDFHGSLGITRIHIDPQRIQTYRYPRDPALEAEHEPGYNVTGI